MRGWILLIKWKDYWSAKVNREESKMTPSGLGGARQTMKFMHKKISFLCSHYIPCVIFQSQHQNFSYYFWNQKRYTDFLNKCQQGLKKVLLSPFLKQFRKQIINIFTVATIYKCTQWSLYELYPLTWQNYIIYSTSLDE